MCNQITVFIVRDAFIPDPADFHSGPRIRNTVKLDLLLPFKKWAFVKIDMSIYKIIVAKAQTEPHKRTATFRRSQLLVPVCDVPVTVRY
jgi:hypothetical protein